MKSAYELAMERLNKQSPSSKLTASQKKRLAELDSLYAAKVAEKEIRYRDDMAGAAAAGNQDLVEQIEQRLVSERRSLQTELEEKKDRIRSERN